MTIDEAYIAMFLFLDRFYQETHDDTVGALLGKTNLIAPRKTTDPAVWCDWEKAVNTAPERWKAFLQKQENWK